MSATNDASQSEDSSKPPIDRSSAALSGRDKFFFGKDPAWLGKILLNGGEGALTAESHS